MEWSVTFQRADREMRFLIFVNVRRTKMRERRDTIYKILFERSTHEYQREIKSLSIITNELNKNQLGLFEIFEISLRTFHESNYHRPPLRS